MLQLLQSRDMSMKNNISLWLFLKLLLTKRGQRDGENKQQVEAGAELGSNSISAPLLLPNLGALSESQFLSVNSG